MGSRRNFFVYYIIGSRITYRSKRIPRSSDSFLREVRNCQFANDDAIRSFPSALHPHFKPTTQSTAQVSYKMLRSALTRSSRSLVSPRSIPSSVRFASTALKEVLYTAKSSATGSRAAGVATHEDTGLKLDLQMPKGKPHSTR